jgi:hypothetical protein
MLSLIAYRRTTLLGLAAITVLYILTAWAIATGIVDDSYIFLR